MTDLDELANAAQRPARHPPLLPGKPSPVLVALVLLAFAVPVCLIVWYAVRPRPADPEAAKEAVQREVVEASLNWRVDARNPVAGETGHLYCGSQGGVPVARSIEDLLFVGASSMDDGREFRKAMTVRASIVPANSRYEVTKGVGIFSEIRVIDGSHRGKTGVVATEWMNSDRPDPHAKPSAGGVGLYKRAVDTARLMAGRR